MYRQPRKRAQPSCTSPAAPAWAQISGAQGVPTTTAGAIVVAPSRIESVDLLMIIAMRCWRRTRVVAGGRDRYLGYMYDRTQSIDRARDLTRVAARYDLARAVRAGRDPNEQSGPAAPALLDR